MSFRACGFESRSGHFTPTRVAKLVDAQSSGGCAFGRAGSNPVPGTRRSFGTAKAFFPPFRLARTTRTDSDEQTLHFTSLGAYL